MSPIKPLPEAVGHVPGRTRGHDGRATEGVEAEDVGGRVRAVRPEFMQLIFGPEGEGDLAGERGCDRLLAVHILLLAVEFWRFAKKAIRSCFV